MKRIVFFLASDLFINFLLLSERNINLIEVENYISGIIFFVELKDFNLKCYEIYHKTYCTTRPCIVFVRFQYAVMYPPSN